MLFVIIVIMFVVVWPLLGCCCGEKDGQGNGKKGGENTASNKNSRSGTGAANQYDVCASGSVFEGSFTEQTLTIGTRYTGSVTILPCDGAVTYKTYFKGDGIEKTIVSGVGVQAKQEHSKSYVKTSSADYNKFCYVVTGATSVEKCFPE
jgi:hypothetical protein